VRRWAASRRQRFPSSVIIAEIIEEMMLMVGSGPSEADARRALFFETRNQIFRIATEA
jgi:hypothetical protein